MAISILLADDHEIFRQGLQMVLESYPDFQVKGQAADGLEAVRLAEHLRPDVVIVDMIMPGLNGLDVTREIKQHFPKIHIIMLSMYDDESYVLDALQNGASGYVLKESNTTILVQAVHAVMEGQKYLSPPLTQRAIQAYIQQAQNKNNNEYNSLTNREREILHLSAESLSSTEIAKRLSISVRTVDTHRTNLMRKLGLHSQGELVTYAHKQGVV
jgi:DNA-binding NarL/FixJ family response regulator